VGHGTLALHLHDMVVHPDAQLVRPGEVAVPALCIKVAVSAAEVRGLVSLSLLVAAVFRTVLGIGSTSVVQGKRHDGTVEPFPVPTVRSGLDFCRGAAASADDLDADAGVTH